MRTVLKTRTGVSVRGYVMPVIKQVWERKVGSHKRILHSSARANKHYVVCSLGQTLFHALFKETFFYAPQICIFRFNSAPGVI